MKWNVRIVGWMLVVALIAVSSTWVTRTYAGSGFIYQPSLSNGYLTGVAMYSGTYNNYRMIVSIQRSDGSKPATYEDRYVGDHINGGVSMYCAYTPFPKAYRTVANVYFWNGSYWQGLMSMQSAYVSAYCN